MIRSDEELTVVQDQLPLIEEALAALRRKVLPKNRRNYEVLSEGYVDQIQALRAEIDAFLGIQQKPVPQTETVTMEEQPR